MVVDPLPAGSPRSRTRTCCARARPARARLAPTSERGFPSLEIPGRALRAAVDWQGAEPFRLAYMVRAVSPGVFRQPAASIEDMYCPAYRARTDAGRVTIAERRP